MAHLHASAPSSAHSPFPPPDSFADHPECDCTRLCQCAIDGLSEALHVLRSNPNSVIELQHALGRSMRGVTALKRLMALETASMPTPHLGRDSVATLQSQQTVNETPASQATVLTQKPRHRRYFHPSYKLQVAQLIRQKKLSVNEVCQELNLAKSVVHRWLLEFDVRQASATDGPSGTPSSPAAAVLSDAEQHIRQLEQRLQQLKADNELLKKASAFFAREICGSSSVQGQ